jgi:phosphoadenosine phosphosulfate reductase
MTGLDPPEVVRFIRNNYPDVHIEHPPKNIIALSAHHPLPPTRQFRWCCMELKDMHGAGRVCLTGVRAGESKSRADNGALYMKQRPNKKVILNPIFKWDELDVWQYIKDRGIEYCSLYDEPGIDRIGCVCCPLAGGRRQRWEAERWPVFKQIWLAAFQRMLDSRKDKTPRMQRHTPFKTPEEVWDWWTDKH